MKKILLAILVIALALGSMGLNPDWPSDPPDTFPTNPPPPPGETLPNYGLPSPPDASPPNYGIPAPISKVVPAPAPTPKPPAPCPPNCELTVLSFRNMPVGW